MKPNATLRIFWCLEYVARLAYATHLAPKIAFQVIAAAPCAVLTISS